MISAEEFLRGRGMAVPPEREAAEDDGVQDDARAANACSDNACSDKACSADARRKPSRRARGRRQGADASSRPAQGFARRGSFRCAQADDPHDAEACKEAALRLLDAADRPSGMLRTKLEERGYAQDAIEPTLQRLAELRLIDDEGYASRLLRSLAARQYGRRGAMREMRRKGVSADVAARVADKAAREGVFVDAAWELGRKVAAKTRGMERQARLRRFWSAGGRKGHDGADLREVAETLFADDE